MKLLRGLGYALLAYLVVGTVLVLLLVPAAGAPLGDPALLDAPRLALDLAAHGVACFAAGAAAMRVRDLPLRQALGGIGILFWIATAALTFMAWQMMPIVYDVAVVLVTWPFFALGSGWQGARRRARPLRP